MDIERQDISETDDSPEEQIELNEEDLREFERMNENQIPNTLKTFIIDNGFGQKVSVLTTDFSEKGLRIIIEGKHNLKPEEVILLETLTGKMQLEGEIRYCLRTKMNSETTYLGIELQKTLSISEYIRLVNEKRLTS